MTQRNQRSTRGTVFPIIEAFGHPHASESPAAVEARTNMHCPFADGKCEKQKQYKVAYCSVSYSASWDAGVQKTYAVCDHRLDGAPVEWAVADYFGSQERIVVPEVTVASQPDKLSVDYIAFAKHPDERLQRGMIAIETQAIDIRGGSIKPAWEAWRNNDSLNWRSYYTKAAEEKGSPDEVNYGINTGNVRKRLGTQIVEKGGLLAQAKIPLYVIMQESILNRLRSIVNFTPVEDGAPWDITFAGFEFDGTTDENGQLKLAPTSRVRATYDNYAEAMLKGAWRNVDYQSVLARAEKKLKRSNKKAR